MFNATSNLDSIDESQDMLDQTLKQDFYPEIQNYIRRLNLGYEEKRMIDHCKHFLELLMTLNSPQELLGRSFFLEDFIPKNIQSLLICRVLLSEKLEEVLNKCLEQTVLLWLKVRAGEYPELDNTVEKIFDSTQLYHSKVSFLKQPEYLTWIILDYEIDLNTLKEGDLIDCIKTDPVLKTKCWSHAEIIGINESSLIVSFINDKTQSVEKSPYVIAPFKTRCKDSESEIPLKEGDDEVNLVGSPSQKNESIPDTNLRISKKDTTVKPLDQRENWPKDQLRIYDSGDLIYPLSSYKRKVYAIQREEVSKSVFLVNLLNNFGENGGFEHIYNQIADKKTWEDIKVVGYLCCLIKKMSYFFHREFALEYIPKLQEAFLRNIAVLSDVNIKDFTLKNLEDIISTCETLLLRIYSVTETLETVNKLKLEICRHCFESPKSETKLEGLDLIYKITPLLDKEAFSGFAKKAFHKFLADNNIYEKTFLSKDNKVLQNSSALLVYCLSKDLIGLPELEKVCSNLIQANQRCKEVFHGMLTSKLNPKKYAPFMEFFISHLSDLHPSQVTPAEISFLMKIFKTFPISDLSVQKYLSFCWQVVTSYDYDAKVVQNIKFELIRFLQTTNFAQYKISFINKCKENISQDKSVLRSLEMIRKLGEWPLNIITIKKYSLPPGDLTAYLCKDKQLLELVINNLKAFKISLAEKVKAKDLKCVSLEQLNLMIDDNVPFKTHISERMEFIEKFLLCGIDRTSQITYDLLENLWNTTVKIPLIVTEVEIAINMFRNILISKKASLYNYEDIVKFCFSKLESEELLDDIGPACNSLKFLKAIFVLVNEKLENISQIFAIIDSKKDFPCRFEKLIEEANEDSKLVKEDFTFIVNVNPNQLSGIQTIWDYAFKIKEPSAFSKAAGFLIEVYTRVKIDSNLDKKDAIREYLNRCYSILKDTLDQKSQLPEEVFTEKILKCQNLVLRMMDKTDKYDMVNYVSNSMLANRDMLKINLTQISTPNTEIEIAGNKTMYELFKGVAERKGIPQKEVHLENSETRTVYPQNGATLSDLQIQNNDTLTITQIIYPKAVLVQDDNSINPKVKQIFSKWFEDYSDDGKMDSEQVVLFIQKCTGDNCQGDDRRVRDFLETYDRERRGYLTLQGFLECFSTACIQRHSVVWNNLHAFGIRNNLKEPNKSKQYERTLSARQILSSDEQNLSLLFSLLKFEGEIASKALELLNRLPTNKQIFTDIIMLKGVRGIENPDWSVLFDFDKAYLLSYKLNVVEFLVGFANQKESDKKREDILRELLAGDFDLLENSKMWLSSFISCGGEDYFRSLCTRKNEREASIILNNVEKHINSILDKINSK